jgi:hypothetical protein
VAVEMYRLQVLRKGRTEASIHASVDADDIDGVHDLLVNWLAANRWDPDLWPEFSITLHAGRLIEVRP